MNLVVSEANEDALWVLSGSPSQTRLRHIERSVDEVDEVTRLDLTLKTIIIV